jgi:hypothetical protein
MMGGLEGVACRGVAGDSVEGDGGDEQPSEFAF